MKSEDILIDSYLEIYKVMKVLYKLSLLNPDNSRFKVERRQFRQLPFYEPILVKLEQHYQAIQLSRALNETGGYYIKLGENFMSLYDDLSVLDRGGLTTEQVKNEDKEQASNKVVVQALSPKDYSNRTGVLHLSPHNDVRIAVKGNVKRNNGKKYVQCWIFECLFYSVKSLKSGVNFSKVLGVKYDKNNVKHYKKISNAVAEINNKVSRAGGPKNLVLIQGEKIFVNSSYL